MKSAKGKAQGEEAIQSDEADDEGRHLTGHQTQKASDFTDGTFFPLIVIPEVFPTVDLISHLYNGQVDPMIKSATERLVRNVLRFSKPASLLKR